MPELEPPPPPPPPPPPLEPRFTSPPLEPSGSRALPARALWLTRPPRSSPLAHAPSPLEPAGSRALPARALARTVAELEKLENSKVVLPLAEVQKLNAKPKCAPPPRPRSLTREAQSPFPCLFLCARARFCCGRARAFGLMTHACADGAAQAA